MKRLLAILLIYCFSLPISLAKPIDVLIYSATAWFRHAEIPQLNGFLVRLGDKNNINVSVTEDPTDLKSENLKKYNLLLFNNSTNLGESIPREIQKEIINWFKSGGGIMAMHAGIVQNGTWPELIEIEPNCSRHGCNIFVARTARLTSCSLSGAFFIPFLMAT